MKFILYVCCIILLFASNSFARDFRNPDKIKHPRNYGVQLSAEDKYGNLWFYSSGSGIYKYNGKTWKKYQSNDNLDYTSVTVDKKGNVIVTIIDKSNNENIYIMKNDKPVLLYNLKFLRDFKLGLGSIFFDNNNMPYLRCFSSFHEAKYDRTYIYTLKDNKWQVLNKKLDIPDNEDVSLNFFIDSKNRKWVFFDDQINMIDENDKFNSFHSISFPGSYLDRTYETELAWGCYSPYRSGFLYEDRKGNIWVKAYNVLAMFDTKNRWNYYTHRDGIEVKCDLPVRFAENRKGELFLGSRIIYKYDYEKDKFVICCDFYGDEIIDFAFDYNDTLWFSSRMSIGMIKKGKIIVFTSNLNPAIKGHYVDKIFVDKRNHKWFIFDPDEESTPFAYNNKYWEQIFSKYKNFYDDPIEYKYDPKSNSYVEVKSKSK